MMLQFHGKAAFVQTCLQALVLVYWCCLSLSGDLCVEGLQGLRSALHFCLKFLRGKASLEIIPQWHDCGHAIP